MLVKSLVDNKNYFWIRIPKTATQAYTQVMKRYNTPLENIKIPFHTSYSRYVSLVNEQYDGFTVVRHPKARLKSAIRFMLFRNDDVLFEFNDHFSNIDNLCNFFLDNIPKIQEIRTEYDNGVIDENIRNRFRHKRPFEKLTIQHLKFHRRMLLTQTQFAFYPEVQTFRYENLSEFNHWIETQLGYDISTLTIVNKLDSIKEDANLDFDASVFDELARTLFADDYANFGYE